MSLGQEHARIEAEFKSKLEDFQTLLDAEIWLKESACENAVTLERLITERDDQIETLEVSHPECRRPLLNIVDRPSVVADTSCYAPRRQSEPSSTSKEP